MSTITWHNGAMPREQHPLDSTSLKSITYDSTTAILEVEFHNRWVYEYYDVPREVVDGLLAAESKGGYFNAKIRSSFRYRRISPVLR